MSNWESYLTSTPSITVPTDGAGEYEIEVFAIDAFGRRSSIISGTQIVSNAVGQVVEGDGIEPVGAIRLERIGNNRVQLIWPPPETDGLYLAIRHGLTKDATWGTANPFFGERVWVAESGFADLPLLRGTYLCRFIAANGEKSSTIQRQWMDDDGDSWMELIGSVSEEFPFPGTFQNSKNDTIEKGLTLERILWDSLPALSTLNEPIDSYGTRSVGIQLWDELPFDLSSLTDPIDTYGRDDRLGTYLLLQEVSLSAPRTVELQRQIASQCIFRAKRWDDFVGTIDEIPSMEGPPEEGFTQMEFRSKSTPGSAWGEWLPLTRNEAYGSAFQFRAILWGGDINQDVVVSTLSVRVYSKVSLYSDEKQVIINQSVAPGATDTGVVILPERAVLLAVNVNAPLWFRLYSSEAAKIQDQSRLITQAPELAAGVIADPVFSAATTMLLEPVLIAVNRELPRSSSYPYRITNNSTSSSSLTIVLTYYRG